ncbi:MAG: VWA domain-containing protein [Polyangiaceae bacterium]
MKLSSVGILSCFGSIAVGGAVFAVTPQGGFHARAPADERASTESASASQVDSNSFKPTSTLGSRASSPDRSHTFKAGATLSVEGRLGNPDLLADAPDETYVMLELKGADDAKGAPAKVALSLVIDKSGSMRGSRFENAIQGAVGAVERLREGDSVSVVAFDTRAEKVVPLTTITSSSRQTILDSIRNIRLGGDTCISCGIENALVDLKTAGDLDPSVVKRMLVLSDGDTNNGIRDIAGFRSLAERATSNAVEISTIGVDDQYNERIMSAIAVNANGRHYFVENVADLTRVFDAEANTLTSTVASQTVADIELGRGVELVRVFDRSFSRSGSHVTVPLGNFARGETKTVLLKVRVPKGTVGLADVANVDVSFKDALEDRDAHVSGALTAALVQDRGSLEEMDSVVADRVARSDTASALREANSLFSVGKADEARRVLEAQQKAVSTLRPTIKAPDEKRAGLDASLASQEAELGRAADNLSPTPVASQAPMATGTATGAPPAPAPKPSKQVRRSAEQADFLSR